MQVREPIEQARSNYEFMRKVREANKKDHCRCVGLRYDECILRAVEMGCKSNTVLSSMPAFFLTRKQYRSYHQSVSSGNSFDCDLNKQRHYLDEMTRALDEYLFVGLTEHFDESVKILEAMLPTFFGGISAVGLDRFNVARSNYSLTDNIRDILRRSQCNWAIFRFYDEVNRRFL